MREEREGVQAEPPPSRTSLCCIPVSSFGSVCLSSSDRQTDRESEIDK